MAASSLSLVTQGQTNRLAKQSRPQKKFDDWVPQLADDLKESVKWGEIQRTQWAVTMRRRWRGTSASDMGGAFWPNMYQNQDWCDISGAGLHSLNIVKDTVRANEAAMVEARVQVTVEAGTSGGEMKGAAGVGQGVYEYLEQRDWTDSLEARLAQTVQISGGIFLKTKKDPQKPSEALKRPVMGEVPLDIPGQYSCECGSGGEFDGEIAEDEFGQPRTPCPECGMPATVMEHPQIVPFETQVDEKEFHAPDNDTEIVSTYEIRMDETHTQGGDIDKAHWFERHYLMGRPELEARYPHIEFGSPDRWSYPIQWQQAIRTGSQNIEWYLQSRTTNTELDQFEVRELYLRPEMYPHRVEPVDFELLGPNDKAVFKLKAGESLAKKAPDGMMVRICGKHILDVYTKKPDYKEEADEYQSCDFRDEYTLIQFLLDADSVHSLGLVELEPIQQDLNNNRTISQNSLEKNAVANRVYDGMMFDAGDWDYDLVPSRSGMPLTQDIGHYVKDLENPKLGPEMMQDTVFLLGVKEKLSGVSPAMKGESQPGEPYHSILLQKQQSQGLLAPSQRSKAEGKVRWTKQNLRIAQGWPLERFEYIRTRLGSEWKDQDVEAFINCDVERDLDVAYVPGSEVGRALMEQQLHLSSLLQEYATVAQIAPDVIPAKSWREILGKMSALGGVEELDLNNTESDMRLAQDRYQAIQDRMKQIPGQLSIDLTNRQQMQGIEQEMQMQAQQAAQIAAMTGQPPPPPPSMPEDPYVNELLNTTIFFIGPGENAETINEFLDDHIKTIQTDDVPDLTLLNCLLVWRDRQTEGAVKGAQEKGRAEIAAQQPQIEMQSAMAGKQAQQEAETAQGQADQQEQGAEAQRQHESGQNEAQMADSHAQREHDKHMQGREHSQAELAMVADLAKQEMAGASKGR